MRAVLYPLVFFKRGWPFTSKQSVAFFLVVIFSGFFLDRLLIDKLSNDFLWKITFISRLMTEVGDATVYYVLSVGLWLFTVFWQKWRGKSGALIVSTAKISQPQGVGGQSDLFSRIDQGSISARAWARNFFLALITAAMVIHALKMLVGRLRPYASVGAYGEFKPCIFAPFTLHPDYHSFPSGHSQVIFCAFVAFSILLPKQKRWPQALLFLFCAWVAFTRVATHNHYLTDVLVGSLIGFVSARAYFLDPSK